MIKLYVSDAIGLVDLSHLDRYIEWNYDQLQFFEMPPGKNHCKLLAYLSNQLSDGSKVADLGTYCGASAIALASNPEVNVRTYDVTDFLPSDKLTCKNLQNVSFIRADCKERISELLDCLIIFLDIAPHDGIQEAIIFLKLLEGKFRGLLICDDIKCSQFTIQHWWEQIPLKKYDLTSFGHWSGTGVVVFDPNYIDIEFS